MSVLKQSIRVAAAAALLGGTITPAAAHPLLLLGPLALTHHVIGAVARLASVPLVVASAALAAVPPVYAAASGYDEGPRYYPQPGPPAYPAPGYSYAPPYYAPGPAYYSSAPGYRAPYYSAPGSYYPWSYSAPYYRTPYYRAPSYAGPHSYYRGSYDTRAFPHYSSGYSRGYYAPHARYTAANNFHVRTASGGSHRRY